MFQVAMRRLLSTDFLGISLSSSVLSSTSSRSISSGGASKILSNSLLAKQVISRRFVSI